MTFHGAIIPLGQCTLIVGCVKKGLIKIPFPNEGGSNMKEMVNGIVMRCEKDVAFN
jgi:hypothetical protein